ncbi:MAG: hypothetical protein KGL95_09810 [Patescibacteria group bacterium]|nr:hypothetical protein [Patescibacteria group bacterium]
MVNDDDIPSSSNDRLSDIYRRPDRIDALVRIAKQEFDKDKGYSEIIERLHAEMTCNWALTPVTQKGYLNAIRMKIEFQYGIKLQPSDINYIEIEDEIIKGKSEKKVSKNNLFLTTMQKLEGEDKILVKENILINELEKTGKMTRSEADDLIKKMQKQSVIYESKSGHYNLV